VLFRAMFLRSIGGPFCSAALTAIACTWLSVASPLAGPQPNRKDAHQTSGALVCCLANRHRIQVIRASLLVVSSSWVTPLINGARPHTDLLPDRCGNSRRNAQRVTTRA
jgi:hypothetical protein